MKRGWLIVLLLSAGLNLGLGLKAWRGAPAAPEAPPSGLEVPGDPPQIERFLGRRLDRMAARLDLSAAQRDALWRLHRQDGPQIVARRQKLHAARTELQQRLTAAEISLADLQAAQTRISDLQAALDSVVIDVMYREREILTPAQRQAYRGFFPPGPEGSRGRREHPGGQRRARPHAEEAP